MSRALREHWPEYLMEAFGLGAFMVSASVFAALLFLPGSPAAALPALARMALMGVAMGATAVAIFVSPWGKQSGAHINPAVTLTFLRLGKVRAPDAVFYVLAQVAGAVLGMAVARAALGSRLAAVGYVATVPGEGGPFVALLAETLISFLMMSAVLLVAPDPRLGRYTPYVAGTLVAVFITLEAPLSGMSMNPARTFGSAALAGAFPAFWVYVLGPLGGMLAAAEVHVRARRAAGALCAKLDHGGPQRCIFCGSGMPA